jgi:PadR family transcriptional regulator PadR
MSSMMNQKPGQIELLQGTLEMLILRTLLFGPSHGHQIRKHIQRTTDDLLQLLASAAARVMWPAQENVT